MKRDDLIKLFLTEGQTEPTDEQKAIIDQIMAMNGKDIEAAKGDLDKVKADLGAAQADAESKQQQLNEANDQIRAFKDMKVEDIQKAADDWKAKFEQAQTENAARLTQVKFDHALERALVAAQAKNPTAARALLSLDGLKYDEKADKVIGLDDQLKQIRADNAFLFESDEPPAPPPPSATAGGTPPPSSTLSAFAATARKAAGLPVGE